MRNQRRDVTLTAKMSDQVDEIYHFLGKTRSSVRCHLGFKKRYSSAPTKKQSGHDDSNLPTLYDVARKSLTFKNFVRVGPHYRIRKLAHEFNTVEFIGISRFH